MRVSPSRTPHRQEQRVEAGIVETLADVPASREQNALFGLGNVLETLHDLAALLYPHASPENKNAPGEAGEFVR